VPLWSPIVGARVPPLPGRGPQGRSRRGGYRTDRADVLPQLGQPTGQRAPALARCPAASWRPVPPATVPCRHGGERRPASRRRDPESTRATHSRTSLTARAQSVGVRPERTMRRDVPTTDRVGQHARTSTDRRRRGAQCHDRRSPGPARRHVTGTRRRPTPRRRTSGLRQSCIRRGPGRTAMHGCIDRLGRGGMPDGEWTPGTDHTAAGANRIFDFNGWARLLEIGPGDEWEAAHAKPAATLVAVGCAERGGCGGGDLRVVGGRRTRAGTRFGMIAADER